MPALEIRLLGGFELRSGDQLLPPPATLKARSLLAHLVIRRDRVHTREQLADLFWPDRPRAKALRSLSTALWHIHRALPRGDFVLADAQTVQFNAASDYWLDTEEFQVSGSSVSGSPNLKPETMRPETVRLEVKRLEHAVALYRGDFLEGFYDDWCLEERYRLEGLYLEALGRLVAAHEALDQPQEALRYAGLLLARDPLREDMHCTAIRLHVRLGNRADAVRQAWWCRAVLQTELGIEPMPETVALCDELLGPAWRRKPDQDALTRRSPPPRGQPALILECPPFVGREAEWGTLLARWGQAKSGQGHLVLVGGEAGVGKSRLTEELCEYIRQRGNWVACGRCYEYERALPHGPLADLLRAVLPATGARVLERLPPWQAAELTRLAPEMGEQLPSPPRRFLPADQQQARLFDALILFLLDLARRNPLLLVLEDLHWAHDSTLAWLHYLARRLPQAPVLLVATYRREEVGRDHNLRRLALQLEQDGVATRLPLARLSRENLARWMVGASDSLVARIHRQTDGNPFFTLETLRALSEKELVRLVGGRWVEKATPVPLPIPASVRQVIQMRLERLPRLAREAVAVAAVIGHAFDLDLLEQTLGQGEGAALEALDQLLRRRLVREGSGPSGRDYEFDHHLVREVVYQGLHYRRRQRLHRLVGEAMERLRTGQPGVEGELAHHFQQAGERVRALPYLLQAGDRARGLYAYQEAIDYYQQALQFLREKGEFEQAARTLMKAGLTHQIAFDFQRARQAYEEGFTLWQRAGQVRPATLPPPAPHALRVDWYDPATLDPAMAQSVISLGLIEQLFSGLVERSPEMGIVPGVARTWEVLEGGRKYLFHLRDDVRWSDGTPVTAGDFEYAWTRVLDPATGSPSASLLYHIKGARAFHQGAVSDPGHVGVRVLDEVTLAVELEEPTSYFPHLLIHCASFPVPRHVVDAYGKTWAEVGNITTNGPFGLDAWQRGQSMVLFRNPEYHERYVFTGNVQRVELSLLAEWSARLERYEADDLDILHLWGLPPTERDSARQRHAGEYISAPLLQTYYVGFDVSRPPFDDPRVRRAFAFATDRQMLADVAMRGYEFPATGGFVPAGMPGHSAGIGLPYDPDQARQLLAEAGYPTGRSFPVVESLTSRDRYPLSECLQAQWRENLGGEIEWKTIEYERFYDRLDRDSPHLFLSGWLADYPDPDNFLRASPHRRHTRLQDDRYTQLVRQARRVTDQRERMRLYR